MLSQRNMTCLSVIPTLVHQDLDSGPALVESGVHSSKPICIMLMAWCCMICQEDSRTVP